jgi:hypothetical protein
MGTPATGIGTPTTVTYRGDQRHCSTQKDAYIWLVKKFFDDHPQLLQEKSITQGRDVNYFSRSPVGLSPKIAEQAHYYERIILSSGRWFANVKLDNPQKIQILSNIAKQAGLVEGTDWSWHNDSPKKSPAQLRARLRARISQAI